MTSKGVTRIAGLRLLCTSHYFESHRGGIEMVAGQLARSLIARKLAVTWAACNASPPPDDIPTMPLPASNIIEKRSGLPFPLLGLVSLSRLVRAVRRSDAVLVHDGMYPISIVAIIAAGLSRRPVILVQHIGHVPASSKPLRALFAIADRLLTRPMLRLASQVVFISATTARHFANVSTRREPVLVFNGVDTETFRPNASEDERQRERQQIGWPKDKRVVLFVGRFLEKKGLLRLREMSAMRPDLHWAFAGWGPCDPETWHLENVTVHRGRSGAHLAPLYRAADVLILPSSSEGFPLVVQEALACGLRPVCCDDGANADPAAAGHVMGISNDGSEAEIVRRYLTAIDALEAELAATESRLARSEFARQRYAWASAAQRYHTILGSMIDGSNSSGDRDNATA